MNNILIYAGPGVAKSSLTHAYNMFQQIADSSYKVITADHETINSDHWRHITSLLVMPGGADSSYMDKLKVAGNKNILTYVEQGGKYLGLCAGAYYAADRIEFLKGDKSCEIIAKRDLKFYPGLIAGPLYFKRDVKHPSIYTCARAVEITWQGNETAACTQNLYYNGGGSFVDAPEFANVQVLARYATEIEDANSAAIVECTVGNGSAILSGVHFEYNYAHEPSWRNLSDMQPLLSVQEDLKRMDLATHILTRLGIKCRVAPEPEIDLIKSASSRLR